MTERIKNILRECGVDVYRITVKNTETSELYFIKKQLDMPRKKHLNEIKVEIFRDIESEKGLLRASNNVIIEPGMSDGEIKEAVNNAYFASQFAANPFFELPTPEKCEHTASSSDLASVSTDEAARIFADAVFSVDTDSDAFINSLEIFASKVTTRIVASNGLDVCFDSCKVEGELVAQCVAPKDVEQYRSFKYDSLSTDGVKQRALDAIKDVRARARSSKPPKGGNYTVVLTGEHVGRILEYYASRSSASMIYPHYSEWSIGKNVQGDDIKGEKLCLSLDSAVPYSSEGIPMKKRCLVKDGELQLIHGGARFCYYLGVAPTGDYEKIVSDNGSVKYSEMLGEGVLEPISFSDFQMDDFDGHFKGEIRLALLHHADGSVEELSGGSINGSIALTQENLVFSTERYSDSRYSGPFAVKLENVAVAGL